MSMLTTRIHDDSGGLTAMTSLASTNVTFQGSAYHLTQRPVAASPGNNGALADAILIQDTLYVMPEVVPWSLRSRRSCLSDDLEAVVEALEQRARSDHRLDRYRVGKREAGVELVPEGWHVSDAIRRIACDGGWWPGEWYFPTNDQIVSEVLTGTALPSRAQVRWLGAGNVWERDVFETPALREARPSAPLFGFSSQALWTSMVFPTEAALLESFLITYDEMGLDEHDAVNSWFVEWITQPPHASEGEAAQRVHRRLASRAKAWKTTHPCWLSSGMPRFEWESQQWPRPLVAAILGLDDVTGPGNAGRVPLSD